MVWEAGVQFVQFIESDADGGRTAILRLRSPEARCQVTLLPLIESGGQGYDEAILCELERQDVILFELGPASPGDGDNTIPPRMDMTVQRALFRDGYEGSREPTPQEFGSWWLNVPSGGGPYIPTEVMQLAFVPEVPERRAAEGLLDVGDGLRLRQLVLEPSGGPIGATVDRLYAALARRPVFVALLLSPPLLEEAAGHFRTQHGFRIVDRVWELLADQAPSVGVAADSTRRLMDRLATRRRSVQRRRTIRRTLWWGFRVALVVLAVALTYYGINHWSEINHF